MITKLKQLISIFEYVATKHPEINDFVYTNNSELPENINLPVLQVWCVGSDKIKSTNMTNGYPSMEFEFYIRLIDRFDDNAKNRDDAANQTHQILDNIINSIEMDEYFRNNEIELINSRVRFNIDYRTTTHNTIGWYTTLFMLVKNWGGSCYTPLDITEADDLILPPK